jgi:hypothetical protein
VVYATAGNFPELLPGMIVEFPGGERVSGVEFRLKTTTKTHDLSLRLEWQEYKVEVIRDGGKPKDLFSFTLVSEDRTRMPAIEDVTVTQDPALVDLLSVPEMEGIHRRLEQLLVEDASAQGHAGAVTSGPVVPPAGQTGDRLTPASRPV